MTKEKISIFWFRRDLRLEDNIGLIAALKDENPILPLFIFDEEIVSELEKDDSRICFIYDSLSSISENLKTMGSNILVEKGTTTDVWKKLLEVYEIQNVYCNEDYEPYAIQRDKIIADLCKGKGVEFTQYKDQVIFEKNEILKNDGNPYTVFTPYKRKWLVKFQENEMKILKEEKVPFNFYRVKLSFPKLQDLGFVASKIKVKQYQINNLENYKETRDFPSLDATSNLSPHLRFGTVSIRYLVKKLKHNEVFLSELIWREFFMQILFHFPSVISGNFKKKYDTINWRNNVEEFEKWKTGTTGYPMVDAGMRELNATGYMHNRIRMVVAGFLCKHLLIDWRWGEAYFAQKLLDYELSSNNGNWQWAAGTGCDAAPYFRVFNPTTQLQKFDAKGIYIRKWIPEFDSLEYPLPMVEHKMARERAIETYKKGLA